MSGPDLLFVLPGMSLILLPHLPRNGLFRVSKLKGPLNFDYQVQTTAAESVAPVLQERESIEPRLKAIVDTMGIPSRIAECIEAREQFDCL